MMRRKSRERLLEIEYRTQNTELRTQEKADRKTRYKK